MMAALTGQKKTRRKVTVYRRTLPSAQTSLPSKRGQQLLLESLQGGTAATFVPLISQFRTQDEPAFCGGSSRVGRVPSVGPLSSLFFSSRFFSSLLFSLLLTPPPPPPPLPSPPPPLPPPLPSLPKGHGPAALALGRGRRRANRLRQGVVGRKRKGGRLALRPTPGGGGGKAAGELKRRRKRRRRRRRRQGGGGGGGEEGEGDAAPPRLLPPPRRCGGLWARG